MFLKLWIMNEGKPADEQNEDEIQPVAAGNRVGIFMIHPDDSNHQIQALIAGGRLRFKRVVCRRLLDIARIPP